MARAEPCRCTGAISKVSQFEDSIERLQHAFDELRRDRYLGIGEMGKLKHSDTMRARRHNSRVTDASVCVCAQAERSCGVIALQRRRVEERGSGVVFKLCRLM